jgi:hypothetical protein
LKRDATIAAAEDVLARADASRGDRMRAQAAIIEAQAGIATWQLNIEGARAELAAIEGMMAELEPHRLYADLDVLAATEAAQEAEWFGELCMRASLMIVSGGISWDQLQVMVNHPRRAEILAHIGTVQKILADARQGKGPGVDAILDAHKPLMLASPLS